ncbi:hypothetical protein BDN72DRAFT_751716, partial [Pluteus cervinus]
DAIRTTYHPKSHKSASTTPFDQYNSEKPPPPAGSTPQFKERPCEPFGSDEEFSLAELSLQAGLSNRQMDRLLKITRALMRNRPKMKMRNHTDLRRLWDQASENLTSFQKESIPLECQGNEYSYDFYYRPLWDWVTDLLSNPYLASQCTWDAEKLEKFDGKDFVHFIHEPWTGKRFWNIQTQLPDVDGKPICILLYSDKTKLSTFGSQMGWPILAQLMNLPSHIRNGNGLGGARIVGWLPIHKDDEDKKKKKAWVDFKRVIWHRSFEVLLQTLVFRSRNGEKFTCGDGVERNLFPVIFALSADYEEQCIMALIRGTKSLAPCPICLIGRDQLCQNDVNAPLRTQEISQLALGAARQSTTKVLKESMLKQAGLRDVDNAFWTIAYSDPHATLGFDEMHAYSGGLGGRHLWPEFKAQLGALGSASETLVDQRFDLMPSWSKLKRFTKVIAVEFTDARKFQDLLKQLLFTTHDLFPEDTDPSGYQLLKCLRSYLNLDMYATFRVHTEKTISAGRKEVLRFSRQFQEFGESAGDDFSVNFPKAHMHKHLYDDIEEKGATLNYTTMVNERLHRTIKKYYHNQTNFRNVGPQV